MRLARRTAALVVLGAGLVVVAMACSDDPGSSPTLPPILTTTTLPIPTTANPIAQNQFYTIEPGDNLSSIADRYRVSVEAIMQKNNIPDPNAISVGQVLELPEEAVIPTTPP